MRSRICFSPDWAARGLLAAAPYDYRSYSEYRTSTLTHGHGRVHSILIEEFPVPCSPGSSSESL
jgi:hypothetical protein